MKIKILEIIMDIADFFFMKNSINHAYYGKIWPKIHKIGEICTSTLNNTGKEIKAGTPIYIDPENPGMLKTL